MKFLTSKSLLRNVLQRWDGQYPPERRGFALSGGRTAGQIADALGSLGDDMTEERVAEIIGNRNWSFLRCEECGDEVKRAIMLGDEHGDGKQFCASCLRAAAALASADV